VRRAPLVLLAGLALSFGACRQRSGSTKAEPLLDVFRKRAQAEGLTRVQTDGKRLFGRYCATCHGEAGQGDGQNAYNLDPQPPDFSQSLKSHPPTYWRRIVEGGGSAVGRSPLCPPWGHTLASGEIDALVAYLAVLAQPPPAAAAEAKPGH
jgi:mono/diheme cytochrome c family protein